MSSLVVVAYPSLYQAEEVRLQLLKMQKEYLVDLEDAAIAVKGEDGKVKLHQLYSLTGAGALSGGFWGLLIGLIFLNPLLGAAVGAGAGAVSGALSDVGINDAFMKDLAAQMKPGSSVLFVLLRHITLDKALEELRGTGGTVLQTSLSHEDEARLREALQGTGVSGVPAGPMVRQVPGRDDADQFPSDPKNNARQAQVHASAAEEQSARMASQPYDAESDRPLEDQLAQQRV